MKKHRQGDEMCEHGDFLDALDKVFWPVVIIIFIGMVTTLLALVML